MQKRTPFQRLLIIFNLLIVFVVIALGLDILVLQNNRSLTDTSITVDQKIEQLQVENEIPVPTPPIPEEDRIEAKKPIGIEIPSIRLNAQVVDVGVTSENVMEVPHDASQVGWYSLGVKPGEKGGSILTGHYDTTTGRPAIFYNLRKLKPGDIIYVKMEGQQELLFQVDDVVSHPVKTFPTDLIFGEFPGKQLIMITCDGVWNPLDKNYSKRLVVFATLWENKTL